jgi:hypothetical protein
MLHQRNLTVVDKLLCVLLPAAAAAGDHHSADLP